MSPALQYHEGGTAGSKKDDFYLRLNEIVYIQVFKERITVQSYEESHDKSVPAIEIPVEQREALTVSMGADSATMGDEAEEAGDLTAPEDTPRR